MAAYPLVPCWAMASSRLTRYFDAGASALRSALSAEFWRQHPELVNTYLCPLCCSRFWLREAADGSVTDGDLSLDDAPPLAMKNADGRVKVLVCRICNNTAGSLVEADLSHYWRQVSFVRQQPDGPFPATLQMGSESVNVEARYLPADSEGGPFTLSVVGGPPGTHDHPETHARMWAEVDRIHDEGTWDGTAFTVTPKRGFKHKQVSVALLKSAYLIAFARFGYRWALAASMTPIRNVVAGAAQGRISADEPAPWRVLAADESTSAVRVATAAEPEPLVLVQMGVDVIVLPASQTPPGLYDRLRRGGAAQSAEFGGLRSHPVPTHPEYVLDRS